MSDSHQQYFQWILLARQGALPPRQQQALTQHLQTCPECAGLQALSGQFSGLAAEFRALAPPPGTFAFERQPPTRLDQLWSRLRQPAVLMAGFLLLAALLLGLNFGIQRLIPNAAVPGSQVHAPGLEPGRGQVTAPPQVSPADQWQWLDENSELLAFLVFALLGGFGLLVQVLSPADNRPRNWLLFLLLTWLLSYTLGLWGFNALSSTAAWSALLFRSLNLCLPLLAGALLVHPLIWSDHLDVRARRLHAFLAWSLLFGVPLLITPLLRSFYGLGGLFILITPGLAAAGMIHSGRGGRREAVRDLIFASVVLVLLFLFAYILPRPALQEPLLPPYLIYLSYFLILPSLLVGLFARWVYLAVKPAQRPPIRILAAQVLVALLSLWLLVSMIQVEWALGIRADDPSGGFTSEWMITAAACAGVYLLWQLRGRPRLLGVLFALLVIAVVLPYRTANFEYRPLNAERLTTRRAERIVDNLEDYHDRNGVYPLSLWQLAPLDLLYIPKPVMYADLGWCYQSDGDGYRFGYVYSPGYNVPAPYVELREFSGGDPLTGEWPCDRQLEQKRAEAPPLPPGFDD